MSDKCDDLTQSLRDGEKKLDNKITNSSLDMSDERCTYDSLKRREWQK